ncbi:MAG: leucine-rich repeat domain-containing protein [Clostridia bacterium]|nr:leucine-rich repeat domain-containing protein [Clostridia bacterium]
MKKLLKFIITATAAAMCALTLSACGGSAFSSTEPPPSGSDTTVTPPPPDNSNGNNGENVIPPAETPEPPEEPPAEPAPDEPPETTEKPEAMRKATFLYNNEVYAVLEFATDVSEIEFPEVPQLAHYTGEWRLFENDGENPVYSAAYTPITYYLSVLAEDGTVLQTIDYTAETSLAEIYKSLPPLPQKTHYTARWSDFNLFGEGAAVCPEFTPVSYTVTFSDANGKIICVQTYDVESGKDNITAPPVPELEGFENGRWESYDLNYEDITVRPVYDKIPDPAEAFTKGLIFTLNEAGDYEVTGYEGAETGVKIPSVYNGKKVTAVGENAFAKTALNKVTIAEGVIKLMPQAFYSCKLTEITLPKSLEVIGKNAFNSCTNLQEITVPDGVTAIETMAFANCALLKTAHIGKNVAALPKMAFVKCTQLQTVVLASRNTAVDNQAFYECPLFKGVTYMT